MNNIIKKEIQELYNSFDKTNNFYEKGYILTFLDYLNSILDDKEIKDMRDMINIKMFSCRDSYLHFLISRSNSISEFVKRNKEFFNEKIIVSKEQKFPYEYLSSLNDESISSVIDEFLKTFDFRIYKFYRRMVDEGRIICSNDNNIAITSLNHSKTIIFIKDLNDLHDIMILLHELAHAYYIYINKLKVIERCDITKEIKDEIPAKIMEIKFIKFISNINNYSSMVLKNTFNEILYECDSKRDNYENIKYLIASFIAQKLEDDDLNITNYYKYLHQNDIYKIINEIDNKKEKGKVLRK